jgi:hypothetical protein
MAKHAVSNSDTTKHRIRCEDGVPQKNDEELWPITITSPSICLKTLLESRKILGLIAGPSSRTNASGMKEKVSSRVFNAQQVLSDL